jgi:hypothetical protein
VQLDLLLVDTPYFFYHRAGERCNGRRSPLAFFWWMICFALFGRTIARTNLFATVRGGIGHGTTTTGSELVDAANMSTRMLSRVWRSGVFFFGRGDLSFEGS